MKNNGINLSKTKLIKILYLYDVEYYRLHRRTYTGIQWKFYHLGPWANEIDPLLDELVRSGDLIRKPYATQEYEGFNYEATKDIGTGSLFTSDREEGVLKRILRTWAERSVGEILDYVYFHTEPMEHGVRNAPLDFDLIPSQMPERYTSVGTVLPSKELTRLRKRIKEKLGALQSKQDSPFYFTPPRYDEEFFQALSKLDEAPR
jgi:hypothetical protein